MKVKLLSLTIALAVFSGCDDEEKIASVEGTWQGKKAAGEVLIYGVPTGFEEEDNTFSPILEFKPGGIVTLEQDGVVGEGHWSQDGERLTTSLDFDTQFVDLSGDYTIQTLTDNELVLYFEKEGTYDDPDTGIQIEGILKATLYFEKK